MIEDVYRVPERVRRVQWTALVVGLVALAICVVYGFLFDHAQFFRSYLLAYVYWLAVSLGCLGMLMLQHLSGGVWGSAIRRLFEAGAATLVLMLLLAVPVALGLDELYTWARPGPSAHPEWLDHVRPYLNVNFVLIRMAGYFVLWIGLAYLLNRWSGALDGSGDPRYSWRMTRISGPGAALCVMSALFFSTDMVMSLEPEWYSTIFGFVFVTDALLEGMALSVAAFALLSESGPLSEVISPLYFLDYGKILLGIIVFWSYVGFSQLLIIWIGNLPHEVVWYVHRSSGGWMWVAMAMLIFMFFLPLLVLLSRSFKRSRRALATLCGLILLMELVRVFWYVEPSFHTDGFYLHWMDVVAPIGIGGVWISAFCWWLRRRPVLPLYLVPRRHPRSVEEIESRIGVAENAER